MLRSVCRKTLNYYGRGFLLWNSYMIEDPVAFPCMTPVVK